MAEAEKDKEKKPEATKLGVFEELTFLIIGLLLLSYFLNGLFGLFNSNGFFSGVNSKNLSARGLVLSSTRPIASLLNSIGARFVVTSDTAKLYESPGGREIGTKHLGDKGQIIGGPVKDGDKTYWQVRFDDGSTGWMDEKDIAAQNQKMIPLSEAAKKGNVIGKTAVANGSSGEVVVRDEAGGKQIASVPNGTKGQILEGPETVNGIRYWHVKFADGTDGWVAEKDLGVMVDEEGSPFSRFLGAVFGFFTYWKFFVWILCLFLIIAVFILFNKINKERQIQHNLIYPEIVEEIREKNQKWERVINHIESQNENDWRLSILEADIMLDDLLDRLNLPGDTMGDKLKAVERSDFTTIDNAWEAHRVRNQIAHEGADFGLTQREARRIVELYRSVFEEFGII